MLNKSLTTEIVALCNTFAEGMKSGLITKANYSINFKEPFLKPFEEKFKKSPNLILQDELKVFYNQKLEGINEKIQYKNFGFWGNNIYSYVWTCVYFDFGKDSLPASYSPQLYILANKMGIKFGFCYGHQISGNDNMVQIGKKEQGMSMILNLLKNDGELSFFNSSEQDITARPGVLFGREERINVKNINDISNNWSNKSLLIKEYRKEEIPENISEVIQDTLYKLNSFYLSLLPIKAEFEKIPMAKVERFNPNLFQESSLNSNLKFTHSIGFRFISSLLTKPFVILTGLSGSGKTKLAQAFAKWICKDKSQYNLIPVGADWTNREPLLGFPNGLDSKRYVTPDCGALQLILEASKDENQNKPFFLILDEMNLSHVERYFADILSVMESQEKILLYSGLDRSGSDGSLIPSEIVWPKNLFIVGTVNIDETTYMFSPKVLDRASVIEFRVSGTEMAQYLEDIKPLDLDKINGLGAGMATSFVELANNKALLPKDPEKLSSTLILFFNELKKTGAEFGYRSASEINRFAAIANELDPTWEMDEIIDCAIMQKLLPKVHGSRSKLTKILPILGGFCLINSEKIKENYFEKFDSIEFSNDSNIKYKISFEKICRIYKNAVENGYASYAEA
jgi:hypothetical protein